MARVGGGKEQAKLNLRMSEALQAKVEEDARERGLSMNAAIISRVEASFRREQQLREAMESILGGTRAVAIFQTLAGVAAQVQSKTGALWTEDFGTFLAVKRAWERILPILGPAMSSEMRQKFDEIAQDKWPATPDPLPLEDLWPAAGPGRGIFGALLGSEPPSQEELQRQQRVAQHDEVQQQYERDIAPLRQKLDALMEQVSLFEGIGNEIADEARPALLRRDKEKEGG
jgi:hypothetical protein